MVAGSNVKQSSCKHPVSRHRRPLRAVLERAVRLTGCSERPVGVSWGRRRDRYPVAMREDLPPSRRDRPVARRRLTTTARLADSERSCSNPELVEGQSSEQGRTLRSCAPSPYCFGLRIASGTLQCIRRSDLSSAPRTALIALHRPIVAFAVHVGAGTGFIYTPSFRPSSRMRALRKDVQRLMSDRMPRAAPPLAMTSYGCIGVCGTHWVSYTVGVQKESTVTWTRSTTTSLELC